MYDYDDCRAMRFPLTRSLAEKAHVSNTIKSADGGKKKKKREIPSPRDRKIELFFFTFREFFRWAEQNCFPSLSQRPPRVFFFLRQTKSEKWIKRKVFCFSIAIRLELLDSVSERMVNVCVILWIYFVLCSQFSVSCYVIFKFYLSYFLYPFEFPFDRQQTFAELISIEY